MPVEPPDTPPGGNAESPSHGVIRSGAMSSDSAAIRESTLTAAAARNAGAEVRPLPPNAPPTNGFTARTDDGSSPRAVASSMAWESEPWFPL